ncbi:hypothetical protein [Streptomyces sp. T028]|uniref:hypothetical protein n=1 Tax=Streptomyces sp. T028 TaxID=3394379 RepID=UPI003A840D19
MRAKMKRLTFAGIAALGVLALSAPNASATSKSQGPVKMKMNPNCRVTLYVDDHQYPGKIRGQAHFTCSKGDNIFTPTIDFFRNGTHVQGKSAGPRTINKDKGYSFETTITDASGTQCYQATLLIIYPLGSITQNIKTPCLNT